MKYAVLGTGMVGESIATKLVDLGHEVYMGSRSADNAKATAWKEQSGPTASVATFANAAEQGERLFCCLPGAHAVEVLTSIPADHVAGKVLIDVANPLDFSSGFPPILSIVNSDSLGEQVQRALPDSLVVKTLNTVNANVMVDPSRIPASHDMFVAGDSEPAKREVVDLLVTFGWPRASIIDLGSITSARAMEMYLPMWLQLMSAVGTTDFNVHVVKADAPSG